MAINESTNSEGTAVDAVDSLKGNESQAAATDRGDRQGKAAADGQGRLKLVSKKVGNVLDQLLSATAGPGKGNSSCSSCSTGSSKRTKMPCKYM